MLSTKVEQQRDSCDEVSFHEKGKKRSRIIQVTSMDVLFSILFVF